MRFAGTNDRRHHRAVLQAIENRVQQGAPRDQAVQEVLDQEYQWRLEEAAAAHYDPVGEFLNATLVLGLAAAGRLIRRRSKTANPGEPRP